MCVTLIQLGQMAIILYLIDVESIITLSVVTDPNDQSCVSMYNINLST